MVALDDIRISRRGSSRLAAALSIRLIRRDTLWCSLHSLRRTRTLLRLWERIHNAALLSRKLACCRLAPHGAVVRRLSWSLGTAVGDIVVCD